MQCQVELPGCGSRRLWRANLTRSVVAAFEAVLAGASEAYRSGQREDFSLEAKRAELPLRVATA